MNWQFPPAQLRSHVASVAQLIWQFPPMHDASQVLFDAQEKAQLPCGQEKSHVPPVMQSLLLEPPAADWVGGAVCTTGTGAQAPSTAAVVTAMKMYLMVVAPFVSCRRRHTPSTRWVFPPAQR